MSNDPVFDAALFALFFTPAITAAVFFLFYALVMRHTPLHPVKAVAPAAVVVLLAVTWMALPPVQPGPKVIFVAEQSMSESELQEMGKGLFSVHCAVCHGENGKAPDGKGADLTHRISFESALLNIQRGANNFKQTFPGGMPPMIADTDRAAQVAHYVSSGFTENERGKMLYGMLKCARCHGEAGRGQEYLGPNIREFDQQTVALVLKNGKNGMIGKMPKFDQFNEEQIKALGLYVISLKEASLAP